MLKMSREKRGAQKKNKIEKKLSKVKENTNVNWML